MRKTVQPRYGSYRLTDKESARYFLLSAITMGVVILWGGIVAIANNHFSLLWFVVQPAIACIAAPIYLARGGKIRIAEHVLLVSAMGCVLGLGFYTGGREIGGLMWAIFLPALAVIVTGARAGLIYAAVSFTALIAIATIFYTGAPVPLPLPLDYGVQDFLFKAAPGMLAVTMLALGVRTRLEAHHQALAQRQQFDLLGKMTGSVAHDFNNLLAVIIGNLELLDDHLKDRPAAKELAHDIRSAALSGADLIRNLQALSQQRRLDRRPVPIATQIEENLPLIRRAVAKDGINLVLSDDSNGAVASVDPAQFDSAILNLCMNARDALPHGGVIEVRLSCEPSGRSNDELVRIEIRDNGKGMTEEVLARALQPFFSTKDVGDGSGLGLAMVENFADKAGGDVQLLSKPGAGTQVIVRLPRIVPELAADVHTLMPQLPVGTEHVLAVEDEPEMRRTCRKMLESLGYQVSVAANAREARQFLALDNTISAVFTDRVMPGSVDGYQLACWVKKNYPKIAVLMTTGFAGLKSSDPLFPLLHKPYTRGALANRLRDVLDSNSGQTALS